MSTVTILWARHGENVANLSQTFSHRIFDGDLTETGRRQAAELADRLAGSSADHSPERIGQLICSPLRRARQTARIIGERLGLAVAREFDELRELNVGALDGRNDPESWDIYSRVLAAWREGRTEVRFPGGEDCVELCARLRRTLEAAATTAGGSATLVVAHGASLRAALPLLTGEPDPGADIPTGEFATLQVGADEPGRVVRLLHWPRRYR